MLPAAAAGAAAHRGSGELQPLCKQRLDALHDGQDCSVGGSSSLHSCSNRSSRMPCTSAWVSRCLAVPWGALSLAERSRQPAVVSRLSCFKKCCLDNQAGVSLVPAPRPSSFHMACQCVYGAAFLLPWQRCAAFRGPGASVCVSTVHILWQYAEIGATQPFTMCNAAGSSQAAVGG